MTTTALARVAEIPLPRLVDRLEPLASALDGVTQEERVNFIRSLGSRQLRAMWDLASGQALTLADFVPPDGKVAICPGKNALPVFSWFQKRFAKIGDEVAGYNHNSAFVAFWTGPGHFSAYDSPDGDGEVWIDYRRIPSQRHPEFPELSRNDRGIIPRLVFGGMVDKMRRVSRHVVIGDSFDARTSKLVPKFVNFALCLPETLP